MNRAEVAALRLHNQFLAGQSTLTPVEIVRWQGAMQSQEFGPAKWSIGQRIAEHGDPFRNLVDNAQPLPPIR